MSAIYEGYYEVKTKRACEKCGEIALRGESDKCSCDKIKHDKRNKTIDALLFRKKWWEFWK